MMPDAVGAASSARRSSLRPNAKGKRGRPPGPGEPEMEGIEQELDDIDITPENEWDTPDAVEVGEATRLVGLLSGHATVVVDPPLPPPREGQAKRGKRGESPRNARTKANQGKAARAEVAGNKATPGALRYTVLGTAGRGAMGLVHVAKDLDLRRKVAIKQLAKEMCDDQSMVNRFVREVQITAQLDHPHIVPVYGLEVMGDGAPAYAMKLVRGRTFRQLFDETRARLQRRYPLEDEYSLTGRLELFLKVCDAMAYAHSKGVIHRDIKPANLMIGSYGEVYVMDWGLARLVGESEGDNDFAGDGGSSSGEREFDVDVDALEETRTQIIVGTPRYMAPEQAAGQLAAIGPHTDQYALGLILFEVATLMRAIPGQHVNEIVQNAAIGKKVAGKSDLTGYEVSDDLLAICDRATAVNPAHRYPDVSAMAEDIRRFMRGDPISARSDTALRQAMRLIGRHRGATLGLLIALALGGLGAVLVALIAGHWEVRAAVSREQALQSVTKLATQSGRRIDAHLLALERQVENFATAAGQALASGKPSSKKIYTLADFKSIDGSPPDLAVSFRHGIPVSFQAPVWTFPADGQARALRPLIQTLGAVEHYHHDMLDYGARLLQSSSVPPPPPHQVAERAVIWTFLGLEKGIAAFYPGNGAIPQGYDPRTRNWYQAAKHAAHTVWGDPYAAPAGGGLLLPCSSPIVSPEGIFLGAVGMAASFDHILANLLPDHHRPDLRAFYLVDQRGEIVISGNRGGVTLSHPTAEDATFPPFKYPRILELADERVSGLVNILGTSSPQAAAYYRLQSLGWTLVTIVDEERYLDGRGDDSMSPDPPASH